MNTLYFDHFQCPQNEWTGDMATNSMEVVSNLCLELPFLPKPW
jgi:hypothetical protein